MSNKVIALDPRCQAGLDFCQKRTFRGIYLRAPEGAKRYYEVSYYGGVAFQGGEPVNHDTEEEKRNYHSENGTPE